MNGYKKSSIIVSLTLLRCNLKNFKVTHINVGSLSGFVFLLAGIMLMIQPTLIAQIVPTGAACFISNPGGANRQVPCVAPATNSCDPYLTICTIGGFSYSGSYRQSLIEKDYEYCENNVPANCQVLEEDRDCMVWDAFTTRTTGVCTSFLCTGAMKTQDCVTN